MKVKLNLFGLPILGYVTMALIEMVPKSLGLEEAELYIHE